MVTVRYNSDGFAQVRCLSTDTKPSNLKNGAELYEMDTKTWYLYDYDNAQWRAQFTMAESSAT